MPDTCVALSAEDSRALRGVCELPLVSTEELTISWGWFFPPFRARLARLEELGLVHSTMMGAAFTAARRYHLTLAVPAVSWSLISTFTRRAELTSSPVSCPLWSSFTVWRSSCPRWRTPEISVLFTGV